QSVVHALLRLLDRFGNGTGIDVADVGDATSLAHGTWRDGHALHAPVVAPAVAYGVELSKALDGASEDEEAPTTAHVPPDQELVHSVAVHVANGQAGDAALLAPGLDLSDL